MTSHRPLNRRAVATVSLNRAPTSGSESPIIGPMWAWVRLALGAGILVVLVGRVGAGPFLDGLRVTSAWALAAAVTITGLSTVCCAWRWSVVSNALGVEVPVRSAVAAYYRSQFLNATLPGGVLGDVHRAVRHGRHIGDLRLSLRSVLWERSLGQVVQILLTIVILLLLPSPMRSPVLAVIAVGVVVVLGIALVTRALGDDLRVILRTRKARLPIVVSSALAAAGHAVIFLIAVRTTGATASTGQLLPLALVVLLASALPTNIAGWGPREGTAAWAFSSAGLTAAQGLTSAVVYGVMALVATLPGALVLIVGRRRRRREGRGPAAGSPLLALEDAVHG
jgi:glycosyltransferase 2 family protein